GMLYSAVPQPEDLTEVASGADSSGTAGWCKSGEAAGPNGRARPGRSARPAYSRPARPNTLGRQRRVDPQTRWRFERMEGRLPSAWIVIRSPGHVSLKLYLDTGLRRADGPHA